MQIFKIAAAAIALATPLVEAASAIVYNDCSFPVFLWSVSVDKIVPSVIAAGGKYSETYQTPSSGGVSIKLSTANSLLVPITQFEYTLAGMIWYDLSNVNCKGADCPFEPYGMYLESGAGCPTVSCAGGTAQCTGAYNNPDDDWASLACAATADTVVYLCAASPSKKDTIPSSVESSTSVTTSTLLTVASATPSKSANASVATTASTTSSASANATIVSTTSSAGAVATATPVFRHPHSRV